MWIEPKGFEEVHQRGNTEAHRLQDPSKWVPFGVGAIEGQAGAPLRVLEPGSGAAATAADFGPGEEPRPREGEPTGVSPRGAALAVAVDLGRALDLLPKRHLDVEPARVPGHRPMSTVIDRARLALADRRALDRPQEDARLCSRSVERGSRSRCRGRQSVVHCAVIRRRAGRARPTPRPSFDREHELPACLDVRSR